MLPIVAACSRSDRIVIFTTGISKMGDIKIFPNKFPAALASSSGLNAQINSNGSIKRMDYQDIMLNLFLGTEMEGSPANIYLRCHTPSIDFIPLLGPLSHSSVSFDGVSLSLKGKWQNISYRVSLTLAHSAPAWFWHVHLQNCCESAVKIDLILVQDLALAHYGAVRINEYYTSQYVDHTPLSHPEKGYAVASRQNLSMGGNNPWSVIGSLGNGVSYATDALQIYGYAARSGNPPQGIVNGLPGTRLQHEHSMIAIQDSVVELAPGETTDRGFFGLIEQHHPAATSQDDRATIDRILSLPEAKPVHIHNAEKGIRAAQNLFSTAPLLQAAKLTEDETAKFFGSTRRDEERENGQLLSFFSNDCRHVVFKAKELSVLRPHVHIIRSGDELVPTETALTSTAWMSGVFHSLITQGHVGINRLLSSTHGYLDLFRADGLRIFIELAEGWHLLGVPSAFEMGPQSCRWIYKHPGGIIKIESTAPTERHELTLAIRILEGRPARFFIANHVAINNDDGSEAIPVRFRREGESVFVMPNRDSDVGQRFPEGGFVITPASGLELEKVGGDELLFEDGTSRLQPYLSIITPPTISAEFRIEGRLIPDTAANSRRKSETEFWTDITAGLRITPPAKSPLADAAARCAEILPWFIHNSLIHYLAPRGIEQYTGGGWGSRDISQGPVELLLAVGRFAPIKNLLVHVFKAQNPDGDWPQWFTFFDRERNIRASDSHGDIVFWPLLALANYLVATEDAAFLDETVPFFHPEGHEQGTMWQHVERALAVIAKRIIPETQLAAYGHGDWNDSMQPFDPGMRERLCSTWTVTLHYQTLTSLATALSRLSMSERAKELTSVAENIRRDFKELLIVDETLTGFAYFHEGGNVDYLLHPRDRKTGLSFRLLPMIHSIINDLLSPEEARHHLDIIRAHLLGPDGARLFDRPMEYRGGPQQNFQRAETASFFGREIGLMYTHAHLRYTEALARYGDVDGFFLALCQANPIGIRTLVPAASLRQANCYYSSSDAAFPDRYKALNDYEQIKKGEISLDGGWRVYSSGPGIWARLLIQCFLGIRQQKSLLVIDPMIPLSLDGIRVEMEVAGFPVEIMYHTGNKGFGPARVQLNGEDLLYTRASNPYRTGAAEIAMQAVRKLLRSKDNRLAIYLD